MRQCTYAAVTKKAATLVRRCSAHALGTRAREGRIEREGLPRPEAAARDRARGDDAVAAAAEREQATSGGGGRLSACAMCFSALAILRVRGGASPPSRRRVTRVPSERRRSDGRRRGTAPRRAQAAGARDATSADERG